MSVIEAVFRGGVFHPLAEVDLAENQRVRLAVRRRPERAVTEGLVDRCRTLPPATSGRISACYRIQPRHRG